MYKQYLDNKYILWKVGKNNNHTLIVYRKELICSYTILKKKSNKYIKSFGIGNDEEIEKSVNCINSVLVDKKIYTGIRNIFVYQTKDDKSIINNILNLKGEHIKLLSIDQLMKKSTNNTMKYMQYVENGICFKGLDL